MNVRKLYRSLICGLFVLIFSVTPAFAEVILPEGAVKGLPDRISAMDSSGNPVNSSTGEYFFYVEDMNYGEVYTKDVQLMNLCDDKAYDVYFYIEPIPESKMGDLDLEEACVCSFYLDGEKFYEGTITGIGNIVLSQKAKNIGYYEPGDSHTLSCSIAWVGEGDYYIDEGHKLVDKDGTHILDPGMEIDNSWGEIEFKWIFSAAVNQSYRGPKTGLLSIDGRIWIACIAAVGVMILILLILLIGSKKNVKRKKAN